MKKFRAICLILCMVLALQTVAVPVWATGEDDQAAVEESQDPAEGEQTTEDQTSDDPTEESTEPTVTETFDIPEGISGDASSSHGSHGLDGKISLTPPSDELTETAKAAFLYDVTTDTVLYSKNPDEKLYPASLTKAMTCLIVLENGNLDDEVTVSEAAISDLDPEGSSASLSAGEVMSVRNLLYCLMVESANDAGAVLAEYIAGSEEKFVEMMNAKAEELGCTGTHFANPHGLHDEQHYTTARDMAKIFTSAIKNDDFRTISGTSYYKVPETNKASERELYTTNYLLGNEIMDYYYDSRVICGKTGFTSDAGRCLMLAAEDKETNTTLVSVVLGAQQEVADDGYTILYYGSFEETEHLLDFGFDNFTTAEVCKADQTVAMFDVNKGDNGVVVAPAEGYRAVLPADFDINHITVRAEPLPEGVNAPVALGDVVGTVRVWYKDTCIYQTDAVSMSISKEDTRDSMFSGGILTDEEDDRVEGFLRAAGKVFVILVLLLVLLTAGIAIRNAIIIRKRRQRRKNRRRGK